MSQSGFYSIPEEVEHYKKGEMKTDTLQFQFFVMCAEEVIPYQPFYELPIALINEYFQAVQFFTIEECDKIISSIVSVSNTPKEAEILLKRILPSIRCEIKQSKNTYYLSPCCCEELYYKFAKVTNLSYKLKNGKIYLLGKLFDFQSERMIKMRQSQERFSDPPQFIHNTGYSYISIYHHIKTNHLETIYHNKIEKKGPRFEKIPHPPDPITIDIHLAVKRNCIKSVCYGIYLIPSLRNIADENGQTPAHFAAQYGTPKMINVLKELDADMTLFDKNGNQPIHLVQTGDQLKEFTSMGIDFMSPNKNGQTILDIKSDPFSNDFIEYLLRIGMLKYSINESKVFWAQRIIHEKLYDANKSTDIYKNMFAKLPNYLTKEDLLYISFQTFVRYNLLIYYSASQEKVNQDVLSTITEIGIKVNRQEDIEKVRKAIDEKKEDLFIFYIMSGMPLDEPDENGLTNLMIFSEKNDLELAEMFAANYCDPNKVNKNGENCFWIAASNGNFDVATMLYEKYNANPNILSNSGETLMHIAYANKNKDLLYYLLDLGASPNIKNHDGETVQFHAFFMKNTFLAELIQDKFNGDINVINKNGNSLGHIAILNNQIEYFKYLVKRGLSVNLKDSSGRSSFMLVVMKTNNISLLQYLLDNNADINTQDDEGNTPFIWTCSEENFCREKFDFFLNNKCDINIRNKKHEFALSILLQRNLNNEVNILLNMNPDVDDNESEIEPIVISLQRNDKSLFEKLVDLGSDALNIHFPIVEKYMNSSFFNFDVLKKMKRFHISIGCPIQTALKTDKRDVAVFLWKNTDDYQHQYASKRTDQNHQTILVLSIINDDEYFCEELIKPDYDLTTPDENGRTPFMHLCSKNKVKLIEKIIPLLSIEAMGITDNQQYSAMTFICNNGNTKLAEDLFLKGINVFNIINDKNGIIEKFTSAINKFTELRNGLVQKIAKNNEKINKESSEIERLKNEINKVNDTFGINDPKLKYEKTENDTGYYASRNWHIDSLATSQREYDEAKKNEQLYKKNLDILDKATRKDILYNFENLKLYG